MTVEYKKKFRGIYDCIVVMHSSQPTSGYSWPEYKLTLEPFEQVNSFGCCGARNISSLNGILKTKEERQEFLLCWMNSARACDRVTYYFIASSDQLEWLDKDSVLYFLKELGAEELDVRPNVVHDPNNMHLFAWCPYNNRDKMAPYITTNERINFYIEVADQYHATPDEVKGE